MSLSCVCSLIPRPCPQDWECILQYTILLCLLVAASLISRPLPDFISQLRRNDCSPQLRDKIWEWPGNEARLLLGK